MRLALRQSAASTLPASASAFTTAGGLACTSVRPLATRVTKRKQSVPDPKTSSPVVSTELAPTAIGPYSQAIVATGPFLFVSGCIGLHPQTMGFTGTDVATQTEQVLHNMGAILEAGGSSFADVVKCTILLTDMKHFATVNEVYAKRFHTNPPARATFAVSGLPKGALVEIECIAALTKRAKKPKSSPGQSKAKEQ